MTENLNELFWFIRPGDSITIFSKDEKLIQSMETSLHIAKSYVNCNPLEKTDLFLFDKNISLNQQEIFSLIKSFSLPDTKVVLHRDYKELEESLQKENFLYETKTDEYKVFLSNFIKNYKKEDFTHKEFEKYFKNLNTNLCSFSRDYYNPYIYRNIIQIGSRVRNEGLLYKLCSEIINTYPESSPDKGGALCVFGYKKYLENIQDNSLFDQIELYCKNNKDSDNPHVARWLISLTYLLAVYFLNITAEKEKAIEYFEKCFSGEYKKFNTLICTKQVSACGLLGYIYLSEYKNIGSAKQWFKNGIERAKEAICFDLDKTVGKEDYYIPFGFTETAELCDIASQCVFGFNNAEKFFINQKAFDNKFNKKRFGLISYCQKLEKELEQLKNNAHS